MPTYTIAGKKVTTEKELSDAEIDEIYEKLSGKVVGGDAPAPDVKDTGVEEQRNFYMDQLYQGAGDLVASLVPDAFKYDYEAYKDVPVTNWGDLARNQEVQFRNETAEALGAQNVAPEGESQRYLGGGLRSLVAQGPLALMPAKTLVQAPLALSANLISSTGGFAGGDLGRQSAEALGFEKGGSASSALEAVGGAIGGAVNIPGRVATGLAFRTVSGTRDAVQGRDKSSEAVRAGFDDAAERVAISEIKQVVKRAAETGGPRLEETLANSKNVADSMNGLEIAPFVSLIDNPIYRQNIEYLYNSRPEFRAKVQESLAANKEVIDTRLTQMYGSRQAAEAALISQLPQNYTGRIKAAEKRIAQLDKQIERETQRFISDEDAVSVGARVDSLITAKKSAVVAKLSPEYERLLNKATEQGVNLQSGEVQQVYNFVRNTGNKERFASMPSLYKKINSFWKPVANPEAPEAPKRSPEVTAREVDSLKREVNRQLRTVKDPQKIDLLNELKRQLASAVDTMSPSFVSSYKALDKQYYTELGIPFNAQGVKQLSAAKFSDQAGTFLTKPQQAQEFLTMAGKEGIPVVRDAVMVKFNNAVLATGQFDLKAYTRFMNKNKRLIDLVPNLRGELSSMQSSIKGMQDTKARLEADYARRSKEISDGFYRSFNERGLTGVTADIINSPAKRKAHLEQLRNLTPETSAIARKGIQASMVDKALSAKGINALDFVKKHEGAYTEVFGPRYYKDLVTATQAFDLLRNADLGNTAFGISYRNQDVLSEKAGISFPQVQSVLRDRISNAGTKLAIIGSKVFSSNSVEKRDSQLAEFMLNPEAVTLVARQVEVLNSPNLTKAARDEAVGVIANAVNSAVLGVYFGTQAATGPASVEQAEQDTLPVSP